MSKHQKAYIPRAQVFPTSKRICLGCNKDFNSTGSGNRICFTCAERNKSAPVNSIDDSKYYSRSKVSSDND